MQALTYTRMGLALVLALAATSCGPAQRSSGCLGGQSKRHRLCAQRQPVVLHGTALMSVQALPSNQELSVDTENTVTATTDLGFAVTFEDTGDTQEVNVKVTLTIQQTPSPIVQTRTVDLINPGQQTRITFRDLGQVQFATRTTVKVDIQPVPEERNTANNSSAYPVIFSLG